VGVGAARHAPYLPQGVAGGIGDLGGVAVAHAFLGDGGRAHQVQRLKDVELHVGAGVEVGAQHLGDRAVAGGGCEAGDDGEAVGAVVGVAVEPSDG
jgi:hypothetical protein